MLRFKKIRWKNFLATGNHFTEINLDLPGSTLIVGDNGSGKSTLIDALSFALYGSAFRDITLPELVNERNNKDCLVELEIEISGTDYLIRRGRKPTVLEFYRDGTLVEQEKADFQKHFVENVLRMNAKTFRQIVVLGSANYTPFMQVKAAERRVIVEEMLDISVFSKMNALAKERLAKAKEERAEQERVLAVKQAQLEGIRLQNERVASLGANQKAEIEAKIKATVKEAKRIDASVKEKTAALGDQLAPLQTKRNQAHARWMKLKGLESTLQSRLSDVAARIVFYEDHADCSECGQDIQEGFRASQIGDLSEKKVALTDGLAKLRDQLQTETKAITDIDGEIADLSKVSVEIAELKVSFDFQKHTCEDLTRQLKKLDETYHKVDSSATEAEIVALEKTVAGIVQRIAVLTSCITLLKDGGIKAQIINKFLPVINSTVNEYLKRMNLPVEFNIDSEFKETLTSRQNNEFSYNRNSEGEKDRLDLAILLTWKQIAQMRNSCSSNLLILDEVFDGSLDRDGAEEFQGILDMLKRDNHIVCISHANRDKMERFDRGFIFSKVKGFSVMEEAR